MESFIHKKYIKEVMNIAYPVAMGMAARTIMNLVDVAMVGRLGAPALAAVGLGGHISTLTVYSFGSFNVGLQALVARRYGEGEYEKCGGMINGTISFIITLGFIGAVLGFFLMPEIMRFLSDDPEVIKLGKSYLSFRLIEFFPYAAIGVYRGYFDGLGKTKIFMIAMLVMNALNIVLNYGLIFGHFGFPRLEVTGAAIGSAASTFVGAGIMIYYSLPKLNRTKFSLYRSFKPNFSLIGKLYRLNFPQMMQVFLAYGGFLVFMKILGMIGTVILAAGNVTIAIMSLSFMPGYGIGIAAGTLIGQSLGAKKYDLAERYGWEAAKLGMMFMGTIGLSFIFIPGLIMKLFTYDPEIIREGIIALRILGFVQMIDAFGMVLGSCLQSTGMTRFVMIADVGTNWLVFLPLSYILGIVFGFGTFGAWISLAIYITIYGSIMITTFKRGKWKKILI